jgi:hypothetical protein
MNDSLMIEKNKSTDLTSSPKSHPLASYHDELSKDLDIFVGQTQINAGVRCGSTRTTKSYSHTIWSGRICKWEFGQTVSDMLDCPRASTLPLRDLQRRTVWVWWSCSNGCLALADLRRGLSTYKVRDTESYKHERRRERKDCFGKTRHSSRIDDTKYDWRQISKYKYEKAHDRRQNRF